MKKIVIVGGGAIGSRVIKLFCKEKYDIYLIDRDIVMKENLKNQLFTEENLGKPKALVLAKKFGIKGMPIEITKSNSEFLNSDLVIDCTDNLSTRRIIDSYCQLNNIPWIHGAAIRDEYVVMQVIKGGFSAIYQGKKDGLTCEQAGLLPQAAQKVADLQHEIGMRILQGNKVAQEMIRGKVNGKEERFLLPIKVIDEEIEEYPPTKLCGRNLWQFRKKFFLEKDYEKIGDCWLFKDGRILVKAENEKQAKEIIKNLMKKIN